MRRWLPALFLGVACAGHAKPVVPPTMQRVAVLERELAWMADSIPLLRFEPFPAYALWKFEVERCAGRHREGWPRFFVAALHTLPEDMAAFYTNKPPTIVFSLGHEVYASTVRHELMHFVLDPDRSHDSEPWQRCIALLQPQD